ncbi:MAG: putative metal-dependent hydrolase [Flavobacteriaceae bacterium]|nr:putative metal-dependent hydrolase [Flavobacteriaceae bacterium]
MDIEKLKFPIGKYISNKSPSEDLIKQWIEDIELFPSRVEYLIRDISSEKLSWKYRPNGWMVKQVIHHCADSHMNSIIRFKLALTEEIPTIRPYKESRWADLNDSLTDEITESIILLNGLHKKWSRLLKSLSKDQLDMKFIHPENGNKFSLVENIGVYSWHCNHHLAHIENGINSEGKYN